MKKKIILKDILQKLKSKAQPAQLEGMAKFGLKGENRLGVAVPVLRKMAKETGKDHQLALQLFKTEIPEAMILASMIDDPKEVTEEQMDSWVKSINAWDICDQLCMNLFEKVPFALKKIKQWSKRKEEFVKRAAYALIACIAWHDKKAPDKFFIRLLPIIKKGSTDERNYVKKSVSWALRHIGKRNIALNKIAIKTAKEIHQMDFKSARWIASDAVRELESEKVQERLGR